MSGEAKEIVESLVCLAAVIHNIGDCQVALYFNDRCHKVQEKELGKTHSNTLTTLLNIVNISQVGGDIRCTEGH